MALLDILNKKKANRQAAPVQAADITKQMAATQSGKAAAPTSGPQQSNVASQVTQDNVNAQAGAIDTQNTLANQQTTQAAIGQENQFKKQQSSLEDNKQSALKDVAANNQMQDSSRAETESEAIKRVQSQETQQATKLGNAYAQSLQQLASDRGIAENSLFDLSQQSQAELDSDKTQAYLAQVAHAAAMSDKKYVDAINAIGQERNLRDNIAFQKEALRLNMGRDFEILGQQFNAAELANMDSREYQKTIAQMDINTALSMAAQAAKEQKYMDTIKGTTELAKVGVDTYAKSGGSGNSVNITKEGTTDVPNTQEFGSYA